MKLWVRSQDRVSLVNVSSVQYVNIEGFNEHWIIGSGVDMGIYEDKARCLEIIDEIQGILIAEADPFFCFKDCEVPGNVKILKKSTVVYEMPEK